MAAVPVRVEPPGLNPVVEVGYDGQELTQPALTMSENLAKLARKAELQRRFFEGFMFIMDVIDSYPVT